MTLNGQECTLSRLQGPTLLEYRNRRNEILSDRQRRETDYCFCRPRPALDSRLLLGGYIRGEASCNKSGWVCRSRMFLVICTSVPLKASYVLKIVTALRSWRAYSGGQPSQIAIEVIERNLPRSFSYNGECPPCPSALHLHGSPASSFPDESRTACAASLSKLNSQPLQSHPHFSPDANPAVQQRAPRCWIATNFNSSL